MQINKINYSEFTGTPNEWVLQEFSLGQVNLIVGRNAVGKTRTINVLSGLASLLSENKKIRWSSGNYEVEFVNAEPSIEYILEYQDLSIVREKLLLGDQVLLDRGEDGTGKIYFSEEQKSLRFQTPTNEVAAFARRDSIQHPFLNRLYEWGSNLTLFRFGKTMGQESFMVKDETEIPDINTKETDKVVGVLLAGKHKYGDTFIKQIVSDLNQVGYSVSDVGVDTPDGIAFQSNVPVAVSSPLGIFVEETDRKNPTYQHQMSQGMFRSLSMIIQINYFFRANKNGTILIDDVGEGIDFDRASSLIQLLIDKVKNSEYQLVMTTNDRYTMNRVPIEYWSILNRDGGLCYSYNYANSKEIFDEFKLTGLSNFDLFSSNYYLKNVSN